ncbi:MAG TPA: SpoIIE family protein phosphatase [Bacteroidales bacterium]|nr:SpoIIE family protein phosphatase [Bacteroidales bacterium]HSA42490.1 SpoIIE family protein phosphatase [Bacteroidales bacterium]
MKQAFHVEIDSQQVNHWEGRICGDVFLSGKIKEENRVIVVLSDGLGHGVKASVLSALTATMAMNFTREHKEFNKIAEIIMNTLPEDSERKISYATFTIIDIDLNGETRILEYDNPQAIVLRQNTLLEPVWWDILIPGEKVRGKELRCCSFTPVKEDRIVICSDGIVQSGMGTARYPFGWGREAMQAYILRLVSTTPDISATRLSAKLLNMAVANDEHQPKDDTTAAVIYFREPRKLLLLTGPPYEADKDRELAQTVSQFNGKKIVCGATTIEILGRELGKEIIDSFEFHDPDLPPVSSMEGIDLVTEGILTLSKVAEILKRYNNTTRLGKGPADQIVRQFLDSDEIDFLIGTRINEAHQDPSLPVELEIRRTVIRRIAGILEEKFLKEVKMNFI